MAHNSKRDIEGLQRAYAVSLLARRLDDRLWVLVRAGKGPFIVSGQGHEVLQGIITSFLERNDWLVPYYRSTAAVLTKGMTPTDVMLHFFARAKDSSSGGRQMPSHFGNAEHRIVSGSSVIATQLLHAVGIAHARVLLGHREIVAVFFGDGATSQGDFHEALNWAGIHKLPVIFVCENNGYAISVPQREQMAIRNVADRAQGYGMAGVTLEGTDVEGITREAQKACQRARAGEGPTLLEVKVPRLTAHSSDDDQTKYRSADELSACAAQDPLAALERFLRVRGLLCEQKQAALEKEIAQELDAAEQEAENAPSPHPESVFENVYAKEESDATDAS